jgi:serralysin
MPLNANEQYLLELINRGRLDPAAEAARYGVSLNAGLAAGTIDASAKQALAPSSQLETAATAHSIWMISADTFSHTGASGSSPGSRATAQGYVWGSVGENIAMLGTSASTINLTDAIESHHAGLYRSEHHRVNTMNETFREIGLAQEQGEFSQGGRGFTSSLLTELFGRSGSQYFLTGVAYSDRDGDSFYSVGEGRGDLVLRADGVTGRSAAAGGYGLELDADRTLDVTGTVGGKSFGLTVDLSEGNVKLDVVGTSWLLASGNVDLGYGMQNLRLLGVDALDAAGSGAANKLQGNKGANALMGLGGDDSLAGGAGADRLNGGRGADILTGGSGNDRLTGGAGWDKMWGGDGADDFVAGGNFGHDVIRDFSLSEGDDLWLNNTLWTGSLSANQVVTRYADVVRGDVVFDFGHGEVIVLDGVGSLSGIAAAIEIF